MSRVRDGYVSGDGVVVVVVVEQLMGFFGYLLWAVVRDNEVRSLTTCESETRQHLNMIVTHCCPGDLMIFIWMLHRYCIYEHVQAALSTHWAFHPTT